MNAGGRTGPQIHHSSLDFPIGRVPSGGYLQTNWGELLWAALTVGRPNVAYVFGDKRAWLYEALFRLSLVRMALERRGIWFRRTDVFQGLDPSEEGAVSYFLGMAVCKLFASRLLDTPWLLHLDACNRLNPVVLRGRSRPDLVGQEVSGAWYAFECKGRSSTPTAEDKRKAKEQARRLISVDSTTCSLHIGAISYFRRNHLEFYWRDPDPDDPRKLEPVQLAVPDEAWSFYYAPSVALASDGDLVSDSDGRPADVRVEIHPEIRELLLSGAWEDARSLANEIGGELRESGFQPDGLRVVAGRSWEDPFAADSEVR